MNLWISVHCGKAIKQFEDTEYVGGEPDWELNLVDPDLTEAVLVSGFKVKREFAATLRQKLFLLID